MPLNTQQIILCPEPVPHVADTLLMLRTEVVSERKSQWQAIAVIVLDELQVVMCVAHDASEFLTFKLANNMEIRKAILVEVVPADL